MKSHYLCWLVISLSFNIGLSAVVQAEVLPDKQAELNAKAKQEGQTYLTPAPLSTIPEGEFGDKVRLGYQLFVNSQQMRDAYVGNNLNCSNCHMDAGRRANAAPLWAAYFAYPAYRKKNDKVNSFEERLQGCFTYSMNGKPPGSASKELVALSAYSYWLGMSGLMQQAGVDGAVPELSDSELLKGGKRDEMPLPESIKNVMTLEQRASLPGKGYPKIAKPAQAYSPERGKKVYVAHCQSCHGDDGQGYETLGVYSLPPLWGPQSFNWGAGMHRVNTAAYFIYENMPFGKSYQLSNQDAWDVAAFINAQERPQDPRFKGDIKALKGQYHKHQGYYGSSINGHKELGSKAYPINPKRSD